MQTVKLNNSIEMPVLGYGVFQVSPEECERCVLDAIDAGYRLIDTAQAYYNEEGVGNAVARKVRAIGLSNFYPDRFVDMAECAEIKPAVNQLKTNVFSQQWDAEAEMKPYDTRIMAWAPLAQGDPDLLTNPILTALAERYNKTVQQVALRYLVQRGIIAIPKSTHIERMKQNLDVFDFTLTPEDMESIRPLDKPADFRWSHRNPELVKFLLNYDKQFNPNNK